MKRRKLIVWAGVFAILCAALTSCPTDPGRASGGITVTVKAGETKYFSLSTGVEVDAGQANTKDWDIAFHRKTDLFRLIFTNGGDTAVALGSSGQCMVYYTEKTDFDGVRWGDALAYSGYDKDTAKWVAAMGDPQKVCLNVMTYAGYANENVADGLSSTQAFAGTEEHPMPFLYDKKQFYTSPSMGNYKSTNRVYIVTHANGVTKSKIQIDYEYASSIPVADVYLVRFEDLD
jgi:hypothetical protein